MCAHKEPVIQLSSRISSPPSSLCAAPARMAFAGIGIVQCLGRRPAAIALLAMGHKAVEKLRASASRLSQLEAPLRGRLGMGAAVCGG